MVPVKSTEVKVVDLIESSNPSYYLWGVITGISYLKNLSFKRDFILQFNQKIEK